MFFKEAYTCNHMKRYVPIVIGVVALCAVLYVGNDQMKKDSDVVVNGEATTTVPLTSFNGKVTRVFEGDNVLEYGFDLPETATATVEKDGALVKVADADLPVLAMYLSFEGGRGYSPADYISNVIVPNVKTVTSQGTMTMGSHEWSVVESEWSVWHVAKSSNNSWLLVVENRKDVADKADPIIESITDK
jgi:hypothetical protein